MRTSGSRDVRSAASPAPSSVGQPLPQLGGRPPAADQQQRARGSSPAAQPPRRRRRAAAWSCRCPARRRPAAGPPRARARAAPAASHTGSGSRRPRAPHERRARARPAQASGAITCGARDGFRPRGTDKPVAPGDRHGTDRQDRCRSSVLNVHLFGPDDGRPVLALHGVTGHAARWRCWPSSCRAAAARRRPARPRPVPVDPAVEPRAARGRRARRPGRRTAWSGCRCRPLVRRRDRAAPGQGRAGRGSSGWCCSIPRSASTRTTMLETATETCADESYPDRAAARVGPRGALGGRRRTRWWTPSWSAHLVQATATAGATASHAPRSSRRGARWPGRRSCRRRACRPCCCRRRKADYVNPAWVRARAAPRWASGSSSRDRHRAHGLPGAHRPSGRRGVREFLRRAWTRRRERVRAVVRAIPAGETSTYGEVAAARACPAGRGWSAGSWPRTATTCPGTACCARTAPAPRTSPPSSWRGCAPRA